MKKIILLLAALALYANAINCLEAQFLTETSEYALFDSNYEGYVLDSSYADWGYGDVWQRKYFYSNHQHDSTYYFEYDTTVSFGEQNIALVLYQKLLVSDLTINRSEKEINVSYVETEQSEDGSTFWIIRDHSIYLSNDSVHVKNKSLQEDSATWEDENIYFMKNDTLFYVINSEDSGYIVMDLDNSSKCYDYQSNKIDRTIEYELKNDTLIQIWTRDGYYNYRAYVSIKKYTLEKNESSTSSIIQKVKPSFLIVKNKRFDLLGRPTKNKHVFHVEH